MKKLSLDGLIFKATEIDIKNNIMNITLNRPEKKNALNNVMMNEINYALAYAKQERSVRVVIISAKGDIFCAGADLSRSKSESNIAGKFAGLKLKPKLYVETSSISADVILCIAVGTFLLSYPS